MPKTADHKTSKTYELTDEAIKIIDRLAKKLGLPRNGIIEQAVRAYAKTYMWTTKRLNR